MFKYHIGNKSKLHKDNQLWIETTTNIVVKCYSILTLRSICEKPEKHQFPEKLKPEEIKLLHKIVLSEYELTPKLREQLNLKHS